MTEEQSQKPRNKNLFGFAGLGLAVVVGLTGSFWVGSASSALSLTNNQVESFASSTTWSTGVARAPGTPVIPLRLTTCSVGNAEEDEALGSFSGVVMDPATGEVVWGRNQTASVTPASVLKIVTGAATLATLGPDHQLTTEVKTSDDQNTVVLVGGGDPTLSRLPPGSATVYAGAPTLQELAQQTIAALQQQSGDDDVVITRVVVDASLWDVTDSYDSTWSRDARNNGFISSVTALQVDGDRQDPTDALSRRGTDPVQRAGEAFVQALRDAGNAGRFVSVTKGTASENATVIASVSSRPVSELVGYMLKESDNTLAEALARHVSLASGFSGGAETIEEALVSPLASMGLDSSTVLARDGSGLSAENSVTPLTIATLLSELSLVPGNLTSLRAGLPVSGVDGSLETRFSGQNELAKGRVFAKTGSISGVRSLAGYIQAADDYELVFAFFSEGDVGDNTRTALETLVVQVYSCGANLADF